MIIFAKADGQVIQTQPTPIYQGSSLKGSVYLVAPFPNSNGVTVQFQLPNGNVTKAYPMTPTGEIEGVKFENTEMSIWVWDVANSMVTAIPGIVSVTIKVIWGNSEAYETTTITTSFTVIRGVPNALPPSTPNVDEWNIIISLLNNIGSKVTQPLMTNFAYDVNTGESIKTFNNGAVERVNFPSYIDNSITEYEGFAKMEFTAGVNSNNWVDNSGSYSLTLTLPVTLPNGLDYDVVVYKKQPNDKAEKMYPTIDISPTSITIHSENPYMGYALITKRGTYVGEEIVTEINQAASNAYTATSKAQSATDRANIATFNANTAVENAETATTRANNIAQTLETAYVNGDFVGAQGEEGESIYPVYDGEVIANNPSLGDVFYIDTYIVGIQNADKPIRVGDSIVDGLGNIYLVDLIVNPTRIRVSFTGTNIRGPQGEAGNTPLFYHPFFSTQYGSSYGIFSIPKNINARKITLIGIWKEFDNDPYGYDKILKNQLASQYVLYENGLWNDVDITYYTRSSWDSNWEENSTRIIHLGRTETDEYNTYVDSSTLYISQVELKIEF